MLVSFFHQRGGVQGPGQVIGRMNPQELSVQYSLHSSSIDEDRGMHGPFPPEVNHHLLGFFNVQCKVVVPAPVCKELHLLSLSVLLVVLDQAHHCCVICVLDDVIRTPLCTTVVSHQGEQ